MARIQLRRGTAEEWALNDPILREGEIGVETNTLKLKIGDGDTLWNNLPYVSGESTGLTSMGQPSSQVLLSDGEGGYSWGPIPEQVIDYPVDSVNGQTGAVTIDHTSVGAAPVDHDHAEYASTEHTHPEYASTEHTHPEYENTDIALGEVSDVDLTGRVDGDTIVWDEATGKWVPVELPAGGGGGGPSPEPPVVEVTVPWVSDGINGLFNALGDPDGTSFINPQYRGRVNITSSGVNLGWGGPELSVADHNTSTFAHSASDLVGQWFKFDFGANGLVAPTRFGIRARDGYTGARNFQLEGSYDGASWHVLYATASGEGPAAGSWWSAPIVDAPGYRYLRIITFAAGHLMLAEVEFWGAYELREFPTLYVEMVDLTGLVDGDTIVWDATASKWVPAPAS